MDPKPLGYVLEWSPKQKAFHVQPLAKTLANNMALFAESLHDFSVFWPDYVPLALFPTMDDAVEAGKALRQRMGENEPKDGPEVWPQ